jgi:hypothetical protein
MSAFLAEISWLDLAPFVAIGFAAQLVDSALGLAFGFVSNALLMLLGLPPAAATAATHSVESFTSGVSGLSHAAQRNIDWRLFARLVLPGIVGGLIGVWALTSIAADLIRPFLFVYMTAIGVYLLWRGLRRPHLYRRMRFVGSLGLAGGLVDASGGGWGPVVTGNLLAQGMTPRMAIGTANAAEFFVTVTIMAALLGSLGLENFVTAAIGLMIGGVVAAPVGAYLTRRIPTSPLTLLVGAVLIVIGLYGLVSLMLGPVPVFASF